MIMRRKHPLGDDPLRSATTRILKDAHDRGDKIIGLTGERPGSGVTMLAVELAHAASAAGLLTLLIDTAAAPADQAIRDMVADQDGSEETLPTPEPRGSGWLHLDLRNTDKFGPTRIKNLCKKHADEFDLTIIDLPPICWNGSEPDPTTLRFGAACNALYLICLAGVTKQRSLTYIANLSAVASLPLKGLILNDHKMFGASLVPTA